MAASKEVLRIAIEEQRRFHDELTSSFRGLRLKILTFIGGILALLAFLYANPPAPTNGHTKLTTQQRLFIPHALYGQIFYVMGFGLLIFALAKLIHGARPNSLWYVPFETDDYESLNENDETKYLVSLKDEYVKCMKANKEEHATKSNALRDAFYPLLIGAIMLIVLRYFQ